MLYEHVLLPCFLKGVGHDTMAKREREREDVQISVRRYEKSLEVETIKLEPYQGDTAAVMSTTDWRWP